MTPMTGRAQSLPPAIPEAELFESSRRAGRLTYYASRGRGPPVLLVHSINAAGSAYEVKPIFERLAGDYRVLAPDLPGFGLSDRSERRYDIRLYVDAIHDALDELMERAGDQPVIAVALSLSAEFLARAVTERPERFERIVLVTPTGLDKRSADRRSPGETKEVPGLGAFLKVPLVGQPLFDLLTKKRSIRYFMRRTYGRREVDEDLVEYDYQTARQPGARHAPLAFVSGRLFADDVRLLYESLELPVYVPHGTRGDFGDFSGADWTRDRDNWTLQALDSGALPHFEVPEPFFAGLEAFLAERAPT